MPKNCAAITIAAKHGQLIKVKDYTGITNTVGALRCRFEFRTSDWDNAVMTAVFCKGNMATHPNIIDTAIGVLLDDDNECAVPAEVLVPDAKHFSVGVWGVTASGLRIVSEWLVFNNKDGCYVDSAAPVEPTPTLYEQIMMALNSKAPAAHEHDDRYYPREKVDDMFAQLDVSADLVDEIESNTAARHEHSNKSLLDKFSEDASGNPLYDGREISANVDEEDIIKHVEAALTEAKNNGDFDGANGETPYIKDGNWWIGTTNTGVRAEGVNGADGNNGSDGVGVAKAEINSNGELVVSYTNGQSANLGVVVGKDGADGKDGKDGINGVDGQDGKDGISATHQWAGTILTVTSASGTSSVDLKGEKGDQGISGEKGADGRTPKKGVDYFTEEEKAEIVEDVLSEIELPEGSDGTMQPLTFTGAVNATYDGSEAVSVEIPKSGSKEAYVIKTEPTTEEVTSIIYELDTSLEFANRLLNANTIVLTGHLTAPSADSTTETAKGKITAGLHFPSATWAWQPFKNTAAAPVPATSYSLTTDLMSILVLGGEPKEITYDDVGWGRRVGISSAVASPANQSSINITPTVTYLSIFKKNLGNHVTPPFELKLTSTTPLGVGSYIQLEIY